MKGPRIMFVVLAALLAARYAVAGILVAVPDSSVPLTPSEAHVIEVGPDEWEVRLLQDCPEEVHITGVRENGQITAVVKLVELRSTNSVRLSVFRDIKRVERIRPAQPTDAEPFSNVGFLTIELLVDGDIGPSSPSPMFFVESHAIRGIGAGAEVGVDVDLGVEPACGEFDQRGASQVVPDGHVLFEGVEGG